MHEKNPEKPKKRKKEQRERERESFFILRVTIVRKGKNMMSVSLVEDREDREKRREERIGEEREEE